MDYPQYDPSLDNRPLSDEELEGLDRLLQALPSESAMNVEAMDGFLTALLVGPAPGPHRPTAQWLPMVWGGDGEGHAPFASGRQRKNTTVLVLRHLHSIACQLKDDPESWQPVFSVAETAQGEEFVDAEDWCAGFLQAVPLAPEAWDALFDDPVLGPALVPLVLLGGDESQLSPEDLQRLEDPVELDAVSRAAVESVLLLAQRSLA